jgi:hypothetical protein
MTKYRLWPLLLVMLLVMLVGCLLPLAWGRAGAQALPGGPAPDPRAAAVRQVVFGIISYTTWPSAPPLLRLCVIGHSPFAGGLLGPETTLGALMIDPESRPATDPALGVECDIVYAAALGGPLREEVRRLVAGYPVLTIDDDDAACTDGYMFCLVEGTVTVSFATNLDSISRSGLTVNPRVLLLARNQEAPP